MTVRNLFRYKKRLFMTVAGIMGCMALLLFGFAVRDSVTDLLPRQYKNVYRYDVMAADLSFLFAILVDLLTNRSLDEIDPVEALKSVE